MARWKSRLLAIGAAALATSSVSAQRTGPAGFTFLQAVRDKDANKAIELLEASGSTVVNYRSDSGDSALNVVVGRRDIAWTNYLLNNGADPNITTRTGDTPLITAARVGFGDGALLLLAKRARVDQANRAGETPLIVAVQQRQTQVVRILLNAGANPDKTDNAAGLSARDYAKRDRRSTDLLRLIETARGSAPPIMGPKAN